MDGRDEDPVGTWTLRVKDRQTNGKNGTFNSWSMQLWGSAIDASKAELWKMPRPAKGSQDELDEAEEDADATGSEPLPEPSATPTEEAPAATKTYVKPTAHLPEDHKEAEGEAHSTFGEPGYPLPSVRPILDDEDEEYVGVKPTWAEGAPEPTSIGDTGGDYYDEDSPGYLAGMQRLLGSSTWLFVAAGTVVVFVAGVSAFFLMRRRPGARLGGGGRGGGYEFAPGTDEEDGLAMSGMRRTGSLRIGDGPGGGRTRELYDAFALEGSDSDEESDDDGGRVPKSRVRSDVAYTDDAVRLPSSFLWVMG